MSKTATANGRRVARSVTQPRSLTSRPLDLLYVVFFVVHIPITLFCDLQIPQWSLLSFLPLPIRSVPQLALRMIGDPFIAAMQGYNGDKRVWVWFETFLWLEILQLVVYVVGARGLIRDSPRIYPLLLLYASAVTTTVIPCLTTILSTPTGPTPAIDTLKPGSPLAQWTITPVQKMALVPTYLVWLVLPLIMTVDMTIRLGRIVRKLERAERASKAK